MVFVYVLKNSFGKFYVGITSLPLVDRLKKHNAGGVYSTKKGRPWRIIISEKYDDYEEARVRERQIKSWKGGNAFKKFLFKAAGSSNGRTTDSESVNPGSNPGPAALKRNKKYGGVK